MNVVRTLYSREYGKQPVKDYIPVLQRLRCSPQDICGGIWCGVESEPYLDLPDENSSVFPCKFCCKRNYEHVLALANEEGMIALQDTRSTQHLRFKGFPAHSNAIFDLTWMDGELKLVTASGDNTAVLWDVGESDFKRIGRFLGHTSSIKTVAFRHEDKAIFATGSRDGMIMIWDVRVPNKPDNCISHSQNTFRGAEHKTGTKRVRQTNISVTALAFQDEHRLISCGAGDGMVKVWDIRRSYSTYRRTHIPSHVLSLPEPGPRGFTSLALSPGRERLYVNCMDNAVYCYNVSSYQSQPVVAYKGHTVSTYYVRCCLSPDGQYLLSGSSDSLAYIWHTGRPGRPLLALEGHLSEVTSVAWSRQLDTTLVTCSEDATHRVWRVSTKVERCEDLLGEVIHFSDQRLCANTPDRIHRMSNGSKDLQLKTAMPELQSPARKQPALDVHSPTLNLPNSVINGTSHIHHCARTPRQKENMNWLARLSAEKKLDGPPQKSARKNISPVTGQKVDGSSVELFFPSVVLPKTNVTANSSHRTGKCSTRRKLQLMNSAIGGHQRLQRPHGSSTNTGTLHKFLTVVAKPSSETKG